MSPARTRRWRTAIARVSSVSCWSGLLLMAQPITRAQVKTPDPFNFSQIKTPDPFNCSLLISLWGEELGEQGEHVRASGFIDFSKSFDQAALIYASYLIQDDLS
jgi:hypothetical protein